MHACMPAGMAVWDGGAEADGGETAMVRSGAARQNRKANELGPVTTLMHKGGPLILTVGLEVAELRRLLYW